MRSPAARSPSIRFHTAARVMPASRASASPELPPAASRRNSSRSSTTAPASSTSGIISHPRPRRPLYGGNPRYIQRLARPAWNDHAPTRPAPAADPAVPLLGRSGSPGCLAEARGGRRRTPGAARGRALRRLSPAATSRGPPGGPLHPAAGRAGRWRRRIRRGGPARPRRAPAQLPAGYAPLIGRLSRWLRLGAAPIDEHLWQQEIGRASGRDREDDEV